jgi:hypothetical protein
MGERKATAENKIRAYLAKIGRRGGLVSRRQLSRNHAKQMVAIREAKRAARKQGKPTTDRKRLTINEEKKARHNRPGAGQMRFPTFARHARLAS